MRFIFLCGILLFLASCSRKSHTVKVAKPIYHHTWYKNHKWHNKYQVSRIRIRWFEKQGVKTVKMKG